MNPSRRLKYRLHTRTRYSSMNLTTKEGKFTFKLQEKEKKRREREKRVLTQIGESDVGGVRSAANDDTTAVPFGCLFSAQGVSAELPFSGSNFFY